MPAGLRLAWAAPPAGQAPGWLGACAQALAELQAAQQGAGDITIAGHAQGPGDATHVETLHLRVHLGAAPLPGPAEAAPAWWLTDRCGRPLDPQRPLLAEITAGRGLALALWQPHPAGAGWVCVRRLHIDAGSCHASAMRLLPVAAARLLWQAGRDLLLGSTPQDPVYPSPRAVGTPAQRRGAHRTPGRWPAAALLLRGRWNAWLARQHARWFREVWRIGIIDQPVTALTGSQRLPQPHWLPMSDGMDGGKKGSMGYWADPASQAGSHSRILAEYFDENSGVGHIEMLRLNPQNSITERQVMPLGQGRHASFPMVVQMEGRWLGLAETSALRSCELHEIDDQGVWRPLATLLPGVAAADPALFQWQGRYWLACTDIDLGGMDNLCLYHADRPEGPWLPHANNPVKVDVTSARMAGAPFWHEGQLYRPAQNCLGTYGAGVVLHRVLQCSPERYEEEPVRLLEPDPHGPCPHGLHTVNAWGARTLVDGKRHVFSLSLGWLKLRRRLARRPGAAPLQQGRLP